MEENIINENAVEEADQVMEEESSDARLEMVMAENMLLKRKLECVSLGVKAEYTEDVIRLAGDGDISEVIKKYPMFAAANVTTGVSMKNSSDNNDDMLRKAFGLKV
ncbi:MAG: hypothetical protein IJ446_07500 [Oscillospiraceae bacterium]|nr:hypothetical protein [Oscillospiraceae bacterium]